MKKLFLSLFAALLPTLAVAQQAGTTLGSGPLPAGITSPAGNPLIDTSMLALNLREVGACGISDSTTLWNAANTAAVSTGQAIYAPNGCQLNFSGNAVLASGVQLYGDGPGSVLNFTDTSATPHTGLQVSGDGVVVKGLAFKTTWTGSRSTQLYSSALAPSATLTNFTFEDLYFDSAFANDDIQLRGSTTGPINVNNGLVKNIHINSGSMSNPVIAQTSVTNVTFDSIFVTGTCGDTDLELADYSATTTPALRNITVVNSQLGCTGGAHGLSAVGGSHITFANNQITNAAGRCIYIASESGPPATSSVDNVLVSGNHCVGTNVSDTTAYIFAQGRSGFTVDDLTVANNDLTITTNAGGIQFGSCDSAPCFVNRPSATGNSIEVDGTHGTNCVTIRGSSAVEIKNNKCSHIQQAAIKIIGGDSSTLQATGNHGYDLSLASSGTYPMIDLGNQGFTSEIVTGNDYTAGANAISYFITCTAPNAPITDATNQSNNCPGIQTQGAASNSTQDLYPSPSAADRTPIFGAGIGSPNAWEGTSIWQEPNIWYANGVWNMLYTAGAATTGSIGYAYCNGNPSVPSCWVRPLTTPVIGNGNGGVAAASYVQHTGMYIEGATIYVTTSLYPYTGSLLLFSAPSSFTPSSGPVFTEVGAIMSLPSGFNGWGNSAIIPITVGSSYALLFDEKTTATSVYETGLATASGALSSGLTFTVSGTNPITTLASGITYWGSVAPATEYGSDWCTVESTNAICYYLAGPKGTTPTDIFRAVAPLSNLSTGWVVGNSGFPVYRREHLYEVDQAADPSLAEGPGGDWWIATTAYDNDNAKAYIMISPMYRGQTVVGANNTTAYVQKQTDNFNQLAYNAPVYIGTGGTTYTALNKDDVRYNNGSNSLVVTAPRANWDSFFRVCDINPVAGKTFTVTFSASDHGPGGSTGGTYEIFAGECVVFTTVQQGWWSASIDPKQAPTISSGFGTSPTIVSNDGAQSFSVNVGTGGSATSGVVTLLPTALHGWSCTASDPGATPTGQTEPTAVTTTSVTVTNYSRTTGLAVAWTASEVIEIGCTPN